MRALFVGLGGTRVAWYRCVLPAMYSDPMHDWAAMVGRPPHLQMTASWIDKTTAVPDLFDYDVVVLQQVRGNKWLDAIKKMQSNGQKVLYETDDYVHGVKDVPDHEFKNAYQDRDLKEMRLCMRACDGMIVSTQHLADLYAGMARKIWVCENGLDLGRYRLTRPPRGTVNGRESVTVLWQGATGHEKAVVPWVGAVGSVMSEVPHATFATVGKAYADLLASKFEGRTIVVPFAALETYTAAMMMGDVAIGPAGTTEWHRAKSQLRAMESMALGIPIVADPFYRETVEPHNGGLIAESISEARDLIRELVVNDDLREEISVAARKAAHENFGMHSRVGQWTAALADAVRQPSVR